VREEVVVGAGDREVEPYLSRWDEGVEQRPWRLERPVVTIGWGSSADVVIEGDLLVSRLHSSWSM
jgi:hypothetical protein